MTQEQKAKAYDEAIKKAKDILSYKEVRQEDIEYLFPELKDSEDEKIRKDIIWCLKHSGVKDSQPINPHVTTITEDAIAWLEKQGEHKRFRDFIQIGDKVTRNESGELVNISQLERIAKPRRTKSVDKIKPKFKVGDSIKTANEAPLTITKITDSGYWSEDLFICSFGNADKWELVEQKPADVEEVNFFDDFRKTDSEVEPMFYVGEWITNGDYTWKIVEVKPLDYILQSQDGNIVDDTISHVDEQFHSFTIQDAKDGDVLSYRDGQWIFIYKEKIDDNSFYYHTLYSTIHQDLTINDAGFTVLGDAIIPATKEQCDTLFAKIIEAGYEWDADKKELKKIVITDLVKDYITQEPAEWSKEDEKIIHCLEYTVKHFYEDEDTIKWCCKWLKSIKDKYAWKPSDGQMDSIVCAVRQMKESACYDSELVSLYKDLKKLREE